MKLRKFILVMFCCTLFLNFQCNEDDVVLSPAYSDLIIDNNSYETAQSDAYTIVNVILNGNYLTVEVSASGCDGSTWFFTLFDSENITESMPPQRSLKLLLYNNESCLVVFTREASFDISPLRVDGVNEILLNIEGFEEPIFYAY